jgi:hypothetical protein
MLSTIRRLGHIVAQYTFAGGYMIVAPDRALLIEALQTQASGDIPCPLNRIQGVASQGRK